MVTQVKLTEFSDLITRYTADFVGREWLVNQVNALLDDPDYRFVVLTGCPGVGKTAFLAHLKAYGFDSELSTSSASEKLWELMPKSPHSLHQLALIKEPKEVGAK